MSIRSGLGRVGGIAAAVIAIGVGSAGVASAAAGSPTWSTRMPRSCRPGSGSRWTPSGAAWDGG